MSEVTNEVMNQGTIKKVDVTVALKRAGFTRVRATKGAPNFGFKVVRFGEWIAVKFTDQYGYAPETDYSDLLAMYAEALSDAGIFSWTWADRVVIPFHTRHNYRKHVPTSTKEVDVVLRKRFVKDGYQVDESTEGVVVRWTDGSFRMASHVARFLRELAFDAETVVNGSAWFVSVPSRKAN